jgi:hypothetical protein
MFSDSCFLLCFMKIHASYAPDLRNDSVCRSFFTYLPIFINVVASVRAKSLEMGEIKSCTAHQSSGLR